MFRSEKLVGLLDQPCSTQRYSPKIRDGEDRLVESMVGLEIKYGHSGYRRIAVLLHREELESGATNLGRSVNSFINLLNILTKETGLIV